MSQAVTTDKQKDTAQSFSDVLRERSQLVHDQAERTQFMAALVEQKLTPEQFAELSAQYYFIYRALESSAQTFTDHPQAKEFLFPELTRIPALQEDLAHWYGHDWENKISPTPTTVKYSERIHHTEEEWFGAFIAHHYLRYLADLSGGQIIRTFAQRAFNITDGQGLAFYTFNEIPKPKPFKDNYRNLLNQTFVDTADQNKVIAEVIRGYELNTGMLHDLEQKFNIK